MVGVKRRYHVQRVLAYDYRVRERNEVWPVFRDGWPAFDREPQHAQGVYQRARVHGLYDEYHHGRQSDLVKLMQHAVS